MKTDLRLVREDVTGFWNPEFLKECGVGKIFDYFVIDINRMVHLCELRPSVERWPYHTEFIGINDESVTDEQWEKLFEHNHTENDYVSYGEYMQKERKCPVDDFDANIDEYDGEMESVLDYLQGNPITW